ncbi:MAG: hypothetical protein KDD37_00430 [Bdellovibrionales bacterium]|nr:hypothetical protein [Bdellovibrionales bacterium]
MKLFLLITLFGTYSANAADTLYCKVNKRAVNALEPSYGWDYNEECQDQLLTGDVCFSGSRKKIIERLNSENRIGSDEDWIEDARYNGKNLQYTVVDGPNEWEHKHIIKKCTPAFFRDSEPEQLPLFPDIEQKKDLEALKAYLTTDNVGNGDGEVTSYIVQSLQLEVKKTLEGYEEASRFYQEGDSDNDPYIIDHKMKSASTNLIHWIETYTETPNGVDEDFGPLLEKMIERNVVLEIISVGPPESCDESEYCMWQMFDVFLSNGEHYYLHLDFTT